MLMSKTHYLKKKKKFPQKLAKCLRLMDRMCLSKGNRESNWIWVFTKYQNLMTKPHSSQPKKLSGQLFCKVFLRICSGTRTKSGQLGLLFVSPVIKSAKGILTQKVNFETSLGKDSSILTLHNLSLGEQNLA